MTEREIARKLKELRERRRLTLRALSRQTGVAEAISVNSPPSF